MTSVQCPNVISPYQGFPIILARPICNVSYPKKPAFYSILAEIPSYACNARVSTKTHDMYAIHALQQNMDPWALPQCLFKGICMKKIKLVFQNSYKKY